MTHLDLLAVAKTLEDAINYQTSVWSYYQLQQVQVAMYANQLKMLELGSLVPERLHEDILGVLAKMADYHEDIVKQTGILSNLVKKRPREGSMDNDRPAKK